jgi:transposase-like protein
MTPPFCPNPDCSHHHDTPEAYAGYWKESGSYETLVVGTVNRFTCLACRKGFSERTFSIDYYTKRTLDLREIHRAVSQSESVSSIARHLSASVASVQNRIDRLAPGCCALHADLTGSICLSEHLVADGLESFDYSQYHPNQINILVGKQSQFLYALSHTTIRRKGRMSPAQKARREKHEKRWKAPRAGIRKSFATMLRAIDPIWNRARLPELQLWTDEHHVYPRAIQDVAPLLLALHDGSFTHHTWPSTAPRHVLNPLFPVNYYDREVRKDLAALRRESTCFTRNVANGMGRFTCHMTYHNYQKPYRVGTVPPCTFVHAEVAGIDPGLIASRLDRLYTDRAFLSQHKLSDEAIRIWLKEAETPFQAHPSYLPKFAACGLHKVR